MSTRREFITLIGGAAATAWPLAARAQQVGSPRRIGVLLVGLSPESKEAKQFRLGLRDAGYFEGRNVVIEWRSARGDYNRVPELVADLVQSRVDVMELNSKRLQLLKEVTPQLTRAAVLWNPDHPSHSKAVEDLKVVAPSLSIELSSVGVRTPELFDQAFSEISRVRAQALYVVEDPIFFAHRVRLLQLASTAGLPTIHELRRFPEAGALISYGPDLHDLFRRSAIFVDRILKGAKPADLPVEQPTKFELVINLKTAKALGLEVPPSLLAIADEVIE